MSSAAAASSLPSYSARPAMAPSSFLARGTSSARTSSSEAKTARGNHRDRHRLRERNGGVEIEALEHAVARHVGVDDRGNAGILEAPRDIERGKFRSLGPAFDRDFAVARIEPDRDASRIGARSLLDQRRIAHSRRADNDPCDALAEPALDRGTVANAAAELHRNFHRREDALDGRGIHRLAGECAVEIDDVQIVEALLLRTARPAPPDRD